VTVAGPPGMIAELSASGDQFGRTASMAHDRRSRQSPSGSPRQGGRALRCLRLERARPRRAPAGAPNMPMRRDKEGARPAAARVSRAPASPVARP